MVTIQKFICVLLLTLSIGYTQNTSFVPKNINDSPVNLDHALSLIDSTIIDNQSMAYILIYAEAPGYEPVPAIGEGIACVDDVGRFMEVLENEILQYGNEKYIPLVRQMTRFLLYMSNEDGTWNNFILANGDRNIIHKNSVSEFGWWAIRGLRGLAAALNVLIKTGDTDSALVNQVIERAGKARGHIEENLVQYPSTHLTSMGMRPSWLINNAPDQNGELILSLAKLHSSGVFDFRDAIENLGLGLIGYQYRKSEHPLNGIYFCWDNIWHNWGNNQSTALLKAYEITGNPVFFESVKNWADGFIRTFVENSYYHEIRVQFSGEFDTVQFPQIAYGFSSVYRGLRTLADITDSQEYLTLSEDVFAWFKGGNSSSTTMYSTVTGRCFDGINSQNDVNMNSGAESTVECLLAIQKRGLF
ncbi:MAG: hypothetical protein V3U16_09275 [Candidatus Neomarinimicrobiota bacterium]